MTEKNLDDVVSQVEKIEHSIKKGNNMLAAFYVDNLPGEVNKDALYAGMAVVVSQNYCTPIF